MIKKITSATPEQWRKIDEIRERWIAEQTREVPFARCVTAVHGLYGLTGKRPLVFQVGGPFAVAATSLILQLNSQLDSQLRSQLNSQLDSQLRSQLYSQLSSQLDSQLYSQLRSQLRSQLDSQLSSQLRSQLYSQLSSQLDSQLYSQLYSQLDSQLRSQLDSQLYSQLDSQLYSQLRSQLSSQLDSQLRSQLDSQLYSQLRSQLDSQLSSQLDSQLYSQLYSQLSSQLSSQLDSQLRSQLDSQLYSQLRSQLDSQLSSQLRSQLVWLWWQAWAGWYEGAAELGVRFDQDKYKALQDWCVCVPVAKTCESVCIVSQWPLAVHWQSGRLHAEDGPSVEFRDGFRLWSLNGVAVDEQIVKRPATQTVEQIRGEKNAEVKRLRIERFGWDRFLEGIAAVRIDKRRNDIEGTRESLYRADGHCVLICVCPSTAKTFALEVPPSIESCAAAQSYLSSGLSSRIINAA